MKKLITLLVVASMSISPVMARNYNVADPSVQKEQPTYVSSPVVQTASVRGTDPTDQRYQMRVKNPDKPAPEFWYLLAAGVIAIVAFAVIDKGPNHGTPPAGAPTVNKP